MPDPTPSLPGGTASPDPLAAIDAAGGWGLLLQDHRPLCQSLEWQLSRRVWAVQGARPFVEGGVPHVVNNSGTLSRQAAGLLLEALGEQPAAGPIRVLEIGAGLGLFARLLLDELARQAAEQGRDELARLEYWVTDASPSSVAHWQACDLFDAHAARVVTRCCGADEAAQLPGPWHAVFANYVLDVLPAQVLRRGADGWEALQARCWLRADEAVRRQRTALGPDELQACAASAGDQGDEAALDALLPLLPLLESEAAFRPADPATLPAGLPEHPPGTAFTVNTEALACLDALLPRLAPGGFVLISDYAAEPGADAQQQSSQRFGPVTALGLNLPMLDTHLRRGGYTVDAGGGDGEHPLRHRLVTGGGLDRTRRHFEQAFSTAARRWRDEPQDLARQLAAGGQWGRAMQAWREAIARSPGDWALLVEAAAFAGTELGQPSLAQALAQAALALNPWTDPRAWRVLADAHASAGRLAEAEEGLERALRIHPRDAASWLALARCRIARARPDDALLAVARGLACDGEAMWRHLLLAEQARAIESLTLIWGAERAAAARRIG